MHIFLKFCLLLALVTGGRCLSPTFLECQVEKPSNESPLGGCPEGTIYVSQTDTRAQFSSVQQAILSLPAKGDSTILIAAGDYHENVNITRGLNLTLLGQLRQGTTLETQENATALNLVSIWNNLFVEGSLSDEDTAVFTIWPRSNTPNVNFKTYNINFENRAANYSISQALVTDIQDANASFYGCVFASYQDTWYTGHGGSTFVVDSIIFGQTDYLFGFGTAWFQNVVLANRACGGGLVAWQGTSQTDTPGNRFGAYIADSKIIRSPDANATTVTNERCYLGRPWNDLATTVYLRTYMDESIEPAGFTPWGSTRPVIMNTTFYAEYDSSGPGGNTSARLPIEHILNSTEAADFTVDKVFLGTPSWIDYEYQYH